MENEGAPWLFALVTAAWFWWMANQARRTRTLWAVGGGAFGLVMSTLIIGLGRARSIPFSDQQGGASALKWKVLAAVIIVVGGWILTSGLHRHHLAIWRIIKPRTTPAETPAPTVKAATLPSKAVPGKPQPSSQRHP